MPRYLISISSSTDHTLRSSISENIPTKGDAAAVAAFMLLLKREHPDGGPKWDTWTVAEMAWPQGFPKIVASGKAEAE